MPRKAGEKGKPPEKHFKVNTYGAGVKDQYVQASIWREEGHIPPQIVVNKKFLWRGKWLQCSKFTPHQLRALKTVTELALSYCEQQGWMSEDAKTVTKERYRRNMVKAGREIPIASPKTSEDEPLYDTTCEAAFNKDNWED